MPIIRSHQEYFRLVSGYTLAQPWEKEMLIRGTLLQSCNTIEPASVRPRLRRFWLQETAKLGIDSDTLKTWA